MLGAFLVICQQTPPICIFSWTISLGYNQFQISSWTILSRFTNITWLKLEGGSIGVNNEIVFNNHNFENLTEVKELYINILTSSEMLHRITNDMKKLEVLDFSRMKEQSFDYLGKVISSLKTRDLKQLSLSNIQITGTKQYSNAINITSFFKNTNLSGLQYLDLSRNMLGVIYPSIIKRFQDLKVLNISHNQLVFWSNDAFMIDVLLHSALEILNLERQGTSDDGRTQYNHDKRYTHSVQRQQDNLLCKQVKPSLINIECVNYNTGRNITVAFANDTVFFAIVHCINQINPDILTGIPWTAFKSFKDHINFACPFGVQLPLLPNLKQLVVNDLNWINGPWPILPDSICMAETPVINISCTNNYFWIKYNFRHNFLKSRKLCEVFPKLKYLNLASNNLRVIPTQWLEKCIHLEYLDLSYNALGSSKTSLSITHNIYLKSLKLNNNNFKILPATFTNELDEFVQNQSFNNDDASLTNQYNWKPAKCIRQHDI